MRGIERSERCLKRELEQAQQRVSELSEVNQQLGLANVELERARNELERLYEGPDMHTSGDIESGLLVRCNQRLLETTGYERHEVIGQPEDRIIHENSLNFMASRVPLLQEFGRLEDLRIMLRRKDGSPVPVIGTVELERDASGRSLGTTRSAWRDITAQWQAEELCRLAARVSPTCMLLVSAQGRVECANRAVERVFGYGPSELLQQSIDRLLPSGLRERHQALRERFMRAPQAGAMCPGRFIQGRRKDGGMLPLEVRLDPVRSGTELSVLVTVVDRSEVVQLLQERTRELKRSNEDLEHFARLVSHDLKAPLRGIRHAAQWLEQELSGGPLSEESRENITFLQSRAQKLSAMIDGVLDYSRAKQDAVPASRVDVAAILHAARSAVDMPALIEFSHAPDLGQVMCDPVALERVLFNLLVNAVSAVGEEEGTIHVSAQDLGDYLCLSVTDSGVGIASEEHELIFQLFVVGGARGKRPHATSEGLGLAFCRGIVERYGGSIGVESELGRGARFWFTLPKANSPETEQGAIS